MGKHYDKCSCIKMQSEETITSNYENNNLIETNVNSENNKKPKLKFFNGIFNKIFQKNKNEIIIQSIFRGFIFRKTDFQTIKYIFQKRTFKNQILKQKMNILYSQNV